MTLIAPKGCVLTGRECHRRMYEAENLSLPPDTEEYICYM